MSNLPLVRLDAGQTKFWWLSPGTRLLVARVFSKRYGECIVLTFDLLAVARVGSKGQLELAHFPYHRYEMWQVHNKPPLDECKCADFYDPEVLGPWRLRNSERHHPMCIYDRPASIVFNQFARVTLPLYKLPEKEEDLDKSTKAKIEEHTRAVEKEIQTQVQKQRPDAWVRARDEVEGHADIRTR